MLRGSSRCATRFADVAVQKNALPRCDFQLSPVNYFVTSTRRDACPFSPKSDRDRSPGSLETGWLSASTKPSRVAFYQTFPTETGALCRDEKRAKQDVARAIRNGSCWHQTVSESPWSSRVPTPDPGTKARQERSCMSRAPERNDLSKRSSRVLSVDLESKRGREVTRRFNAHLRRSCEAERTRGNARPVPTDKRRVGVSGVPTPEDGGLGDAAESEGESLFSFSAENGACDLEAPPRRERPRRRPPDVEAAAFYGVAPPALVATQREKQSTAQWVDLGGGRSPGEESSRLDGPSRPTAGGKARQREVDTAGDLAGWMALRSASEQGAFGRQTGREARATQTSKVNSCRQTRTDEERLSWTTEHLRRAARAETRSRRQKGERGDDAHRLGDEAREAELTSAPGKDAQEASAVAHVAVLFKRSLKQLLVPVIGPASSSSGAAASQALPNLSLSVSGSESLEVSSSAVKKPLLLRSSFPLLFGFLYQMQERQAAFVSQQREQRLQSMRDATPSPPRTLRLAQRRLLQLQRELASLREELQTQQRSPERCADAQAERHALLVPPILTQQLEQILVENADSFSLVDLHLLLTLSSAQAQFALSLRPSGGRASELLDARLRASPAEPRSGGRGVFEEENASVARAAAVACFASEPLQTETLEKVSRGFLQGLGKDVWLLHALLSPRLLARVSQVASRRLRELRGAQRRQFADFTRLLSLCALEAAPKGARKEEGNEGDLEKEEESLQGETQSELRRPVDGDLGSGIHSLHAMERPELFMSMDSCSESPISLSHKSRIQNAWREGHRRDAKTVERLLLLFVTLHTRVGALTCSFAPGSSSSPSSSPRSSPSPVAAASSSAGAFSGSQLMELALAAQSSLTSGDLLDSLCDSLLCLLTTPYELSSATRLPPSLCRAVPTPAKGRTQTEDRGDRRCEEGRRRSESEARAVSDNGDSARRKGESLGAPPAACGDAAKLLNRLSDPQTSREEFEEAEKPASNDEREEERREQRGDERKEERGDDIRNEAEEEEGGRTKMRGSSEFVAEESLRKTERGRFRGQQRIENHLEASAAEPSGDSETSGILPVFTEGKGEAKTAAPILLHPSSLSRLILVFFTPFFQSALEPSPCRQRMQRGVCTPEKALALCRAVSSQVERQREKMKATDLQKCVSSLLIFRAICRASAPAPEQKSLRDTFHGAAASTSSREIRVSPSPCSSHSSTSSSSAFSSPSASSASSSLPPLCTGSQEAASGPGPTRPSLACGEQTADERRERGEEQTVEAEKWRAQFWGELDGLAECLVSELVRETRDTSSLPESLLSQSRGFLLERVSETQRAGRGRSEVPTESREEEQLCGEQEERKKVWLLKEIRRLLHSLPRAGPRGSEEPEEEHGERYASTFDSENKHTERKEIDFEGTPKKREETGEGDVFAGNANCGLSREALPSSSSCFSGSLSSQSSKSYHPSVCKRSSSPSSSASSSSPSSASSSSSSSSASSSSSSSSSPSFSAFSASPVPPSSFPSSRVLSPSDSSSLASHLSSSACGFVVERSGACLAFSSLFSSVFPSSILSHSRSLRGTAASLAAVRKHRRRMQQPVHFLAHFEKFRRKQEEKSREAELLRAFGRVLLARAKVEEKRQTADRRSSNLVRQCMSAFLEQRGDTRLMDALLLPSLSLCFHLQVAEAKRLSSERLARNSGRLCRIEGRRRLEHDRERHGETDSENETDRGARGTAEESRSVPNSECRRTIERHIEGNGEQERGSREARAKEDDVDQEDLPFVGPVGVLKELQQLLLLPPESWERHLASRPLLRLLQLLKLSGRHYTGICEFLTNNEELLLLPRLATTQGERARQRGVDGSCAQSIANERGDGAHAETTRIGRKKWKNSSSSEASRAERPWRRQEGVLGEGGETTEIHRDRTDAANAERHSKDVHTEPLVVVLQTKKTNERERRDRLEREEVKQREGRTTLQSAEGTKDVNVYLGDFNAQRDFRFSLNMRDPLGIRTLNSLSFLPFAVASERRLDAFLLTLIRVILLQLRQLPAASCPRSARYDDISHCHTPLDPSASPPSSSYFSASSSSSSSSSSLLSFSSPLDPHSSGASPLSASPRSPAVFQSVPQSAALGVGLLHALALLTEQLKAKNVSSSPLQREGDSAILLRHLAHATGEEVLQLLLPGDRLSKLSLLHFLRLVVATNNLFLSPCLPASLAASTQGVVLSTGRGGGSDKSVVPQSLEVPRARPPFAEKEGKELVFRGNLSRDEETNETLWTRPAPALSPGVQRHLRALAATASWLLLPEESHRTQPSPASRERERNEEGGVNRFAASEKRIEVSMGSERDGGEEKSTATGAGRRNAQARRRKIAREAKECRGERAGEEAFETEKKARKETEVPAFCAVPPSALAPLTRSFAEVYRHLTQLSVHLRSRDEFARSSLPRQSELQRTGNLAGIPEGDSFPVLSPAYEQEVDMVEVLREAYEELLLLLAAAALSAQRSLTQTQWKTIGQALLFSVCTAEFLPFFEATLPLCRRGAIIEPREETEENDLSASLLDVDAAVMDLLLFLRFLSRCPASDSRSSSPTCLLSSSSLASSVFRVPLESETEQGRRDSEAEKEEGRNTRESLRSREQCNRERGGFRFSVSPEKGRSFAERDLPPTEKSCRSSEELATQTVERLLLLVDREGAAVREKAKQRRRREDVLKGAEGERHPEATEKETEGGCSEKEGKTTQRQRRRDVYLQTLRLLGGECDTHLLGQVLKGYLRAERVERREDRDRFLRLKRNALHTLLVLSSLDA
ncbi:hypothetical protein TGME49_321370 [Toxoplasma gondii ME49]|uniref:Uncharacterized protein n=1 Tax=Toxoplasma gondii (strain ATCC 50611 / Me49) TaxID=508771 RepID=S8GUF9_TOXGM|nr:hypothetical protein TGME49_321370 [Toxoplasma gondii ME49]EPT32229.1 hypothetical protein TGME49_321370 [Toxoplasma gondii ME49]|eukprot:XP_018638397.1 hypothetical protein TGME49_321370 [Toxoplasma gondii ME49]